MKEAKNESRRLCFGFRSKVGRAMTISDNTQTYYPQPVYATMKAWKVVIQHNQGRHWQLGKHNCKCNGKFYFRIKKLKL
jgi:hypothetical protein